MEAGLEIQRIPLVSKLEISGLLAWMYSLSVGGKVAGMRSVTAPAKK